MCGIVGLFGLKNDAPHRERWSHLVNHLHHRGPDEGAFWAEGPFFLGHRRLSILDLSTGQQPMASRDGRFVVTFNGEIYNYLELRKELEACGHAFRTHSDTEVLVAGYQEWGVDLPKHLTGMFAFAIADRNKKELFLARDRFGEKPIFIARGPTYVAFASELRPIAALPDFNRRLNVPALASFLCLNYVSGEETLLENVRRVRPASWIKFGPSGEESGDYWHLPESAENASADPIEGSIRRLHEKLDHAVKLNLRSDVPVGIFLSGGIDSCLVAESAMRQGKLNRAFCLDFDEASYSEYSAAKHVAAKLGLPLERVRFTSESLQNFLKLMEHADDPLADSSALALYTLSHHAKQRGNKVVLGGDGGDELFAGYLTYRATQIHSQFIARMPNPIRRLLADSSQFLPVSENKVTFSYKLWRFLRAATLPSKEAHFTWNGSWLPEDAARFFKDADQATWARGALARLISEKPSGAPSNLLDLQKTDIREYLANDILVKTDRMSMAHGLEIRAPFLEHELARWALTRPVNQKIGKKGELKSLLRAAVRRLYGSKVADRPKQGFSIPVHAWIRGPLEPMVRDLLSKTSLRAMEVLDSQKITKVVDDHFEKKRSYGFEIWGLAILSAWYRHRILNVPPAPPPLELTERKIVA